MQKLQAFDLLESVGEAVKANDDYINDLIRERLNEKGEDAKGKAVKTIGKKLPGHAYSPGYVRLKAGRYGRQTRHVDLNLAEKWHRSMTLKIEKELMQIETPEHPVEKLEIERLNTKIASIITLSEAEKTKVAKQIKNDLIQNIRQKIGV